MVDLQPAALRGPLSEVQYPSPEVVECPYPFYDRLRDEAPVHPWPGQPNHYLVSRWEDITYITEHPDLFHVGLPPGSPEMPGDYPTADAASESPGHDFGYSPRGSAGSNPPEHRLKRRLENPLIARERLNAYEPRLRDLCNGLIDAFIDRGECEFMQDFAHPLPIFVIGELLGFPHEDGPMLWSWTEGVGNSQRFLPPEKQAQHVGGQEKLRQYSRRAVLDRYEQPRDDFLTELIQAQLEHDDGVLNLEFLANEVPLLIHAGNSTTAFMLGSAMMLLLQHPEQMEQVRADRSLIGHMLDEVMRIETPVQWTRRWAREATRIGEVEVPAGALLVMMWAAGNRDPRKFDDPETFDVDRPEVVKHQLAFGRGIHLCMGAPLARLEGRVAFETIFERLEDMRLLEGRNDFLHVELANKRAPRMVHMAFERAAGG